MSNYAIIEKLKSSNSVCLIGHSTPDADALCSMVVFKNFLKQKFNISIIDMFADFDKLAENYTYILGDEKINKQSTTNYDYAITLDTSNPVLLGKYTELFNMAQHKIVIDHHNTNLRYGQYNIVKYCSSTCEMVYRILCHFKHNFDVEDYGKIYAGIITDTNNLTVGNISYKTFNIVGECYKYADCQKIYKHFFCNNSLKTQKMFSTAVQNIKVFNNGKILISHITMDEHNALNAEKDDYTGIVNRLAQTSNVELVCFVHPKNNKYYVSMRATKGYNVAEIAKKHGGGGHIGAAAFETNEDVETIEKIILEDFTNEIINKNLIFSKNPFKND